MIRLKNILEAKNARGIEVRPVQNTEELKIFDEFTKQHYLGNNPKGMTEKYIVMHNDSPIGLIGYGVPTSVMLRRSLNLNSGELLELRRLFILDDVNIHNIESQVISLGNEELKKSKPVVKLVITYADSKQGHTGVIYQATNAVYDGIRGGKHRYFYFLGSKSEKRRTLKQTNINSMEYPK